MLTLLLLACGGDPDLEPPPPATTAETGAPTPLPTGHTAADTAAPPARWVGELALDAVALRIDGVTGGVGAGDQVAAADVDGDGFVDLVVGARLDQQARGRVSVLRGPVAAGSLDAAAFHLIGGAPGDVFGGAVGTAGDVDGDGAEELLVGAKYAGGSGRAYLFDADGRVGEIAAADAATTVFDGEGAMLLGGSVGPATGWLAGGGPAVWVTARDAAEAAGAVFVFDAPASGGRRPVTAAAATRVGGQRGDLFGASAFGVVDLTGDGVPDWLGCACGGDGGDVDSGGVHLLAGPLAPGAAPVPMAEAAFTLARAAAAVGAVAAGGDIDGDGVGDVVIGAPDVDAAWFAPASGGDLDAAPGRFVGGAGSRFGQAVAGLDLDGDGLSDVVVGAPGHGDGGGVAVWYGPARGGPADLWLLGPPGAEAGTALRADRDVTGDGVPDVVVGGPGGAGAVWVLPGQADRK